jgi:hypothetical protein
MDPGGLTRRSRSFFRLCAGSAPLASALGCRRGVRRRSGRLHRHPWRSVLRLVGVSWVARVQARWCSGRLNGPDRSLAPPRPTAQPRQLDTFIPRRRRSETQIDRAQAASLRDSRPASITFGVIDDSTCDTGWRRAVARLGDTGVRAYSRVSTTRSMPQVGHTRRNVRTLVAASYRVVQS